MSCGSGKALGGLSAKVHAATPFVGQAVYNGVKVVNRPAVAERQHELPQGSVSAPPEETRLLRLPPTKSQQVEKEEGPSLPGISYESTPTAPLPPPMTNCSCNRRRAVTVG